MKKRHLHRRFLVPNARDEFGYTEDESLLDLDEREEISNQASKAIRHWIGELGDPLFVYFIQATDGGPVKIGKALNPLKRLRTLQCGSVQTLAIREVVLAAVDTEETVHAMWGSEAGMRGEWFGRGHEDEILRCAHEASAKQMQMGAGYGTASAATWLIREAKDAPNWRTA